MEKFLLNFIDPAIEQSFKSSALGLGSKLFCLVIIMVLYDICAYGFPGIIKEGDNLNNKIILIGMSFMMIALTLVGFFLRKYQRCLRYYSLGLIFLYLIIVVELSRSSSDDKADTFLYALSVNFLLSCVIYFNFPWLVYVFYHFALVILILSMIFGVKDWVPEKYLKFFFLVMLNGIVSYIIERSNRESYLELYNSNNFAQTFQTLIKDVLPTPIIIRTIKNPSICFYNQAMVQTIKNEKRIEEERGFLEFYKKTENEDSVIKKIITDKMRMMKITPNEEGSTTNLNNLIEFLENFDGELAKEQQNSPSNSPQLFLHKKIYIPKKEISSFIGQNLNLQPLKEEDEKYFDAKIQKINWQNEECFMIILNDITSIISLAKFKDIDIYKNRLLATVSHDLRTPINGMLGMIETVSDEIKEKKNKKLLKIAVKFGHLLLSMVNDILDFSKISNFQLSLNFELIDVVQLVKDVCRLIKFQIKNKGIEFIFEKQFLQEHLIVNTDPNRLKQILLNLLSNALKFTFHGYIKVIMEITEENLLKICVVDTGIGIKKENISKLFTLFGKLKQDDPNINKQGVGLGLVISQNLAKLLYKSANNGIHVESIWQEGSKFWFYAAKLQMNEEEEMKYEPFFDAINAVPSVNIRNNNDLVIRNLSPKKKSIQEIFSPIKRRRDFLVLIVDDDQLNLMVSKEYMKFFEIDYILAYNGKEALNLVYEKVIFEQARIDVILMDCNMPIMDGFTAVQKINEMLIENEKPLIPIIALTANVSNVDIEFCFQAGMNYYLAKPVSRKEISKLLSSILKTELPY